MKTIMRLPELWKRVFTATACSGLWLFVGLAQAQGTSWTLRNPLPTDEYLQAVAWSGTQLVAVGQNGAVLTSPNGVAWTVRWSGTTLALTGVVWTGSQFVAVGDGGSIRTSTDGIAWTPRTSGTTKDLKAICWTGSSLVTIGDEGTVLTSATGITWTARFSNTAEELKAVVWTGTGLVAVGELGVTLTSSTGTSWALASQSPALTFTSITHDGAQFIATASNGTLHTSPTGALWTQRYSSGSDSFLGVKWTGSLAVAVGSGGSVLTSPDGVSWTVQVSGVDSVLYALTQAGATTVAVGASGIILISPNGSSWTNQSQVSNADLRDVAWTGEELIVIGAEGVVLTSPSGALWTVQSCGVTDDLEALAWVGNGVVAVGENGGVLTSPDGVTWTPQSSGSLERLLGVTWTRSLMVAVGENGTILTSPDGVAWTSQFSGTARDLRSVVWTGSRLVAVGTVGTVVTSLDGLVWTSATLSPFTDLSEVTWTGSQLIAVGDSDTVLTSTNAVTWVQRSLAFGQNLQGVAWTGSLYVAVGTNRTILTSPTAAVWTRPIPSSTKLPHLHSVEWAGSQLIAVGDSGTIMTSGTAAAPTPAVNFTITSQTVTEDVGTVALGVQLSFAPASTLTLPFVLTGSTATLGSSADYLITAAPLTFAAGQSFKTLTITVKNDVLVEAPETVRVSVGSPAKAFIGTANVFTLTVNSDDVAPVITLDPVSQIVPLGQSVTAFSSAATGSSPLSFQWRKNGVNINNATGASYSLFNVPLSSAGKYSVAAINPTATAISAVADLAVVNTSAATHMIAQGQTATLTVSAQGNNLTYLWKKAGVPMSNGGRISGVTASRLMINSLIPLDSAIYTCDVTAPGGVLTGGNQTLNVLVPPVMNSTLYPSTMMSDGSYSYTLGAANFPATFNLTGLPKGLTWNKTTGVISGRPAASGTFIVRASATNAAGTSATVSAALVVQALPTGTVGSFIGLIDRAATVNDDLGGRLDLTTTSSGSFTVKVTQQGKSYSAIGMMDTTFGSDPQVNVTLPRTSLPNLQLALSLDGATQSLSGTLGTGGPTTNVEGWRQAWNASYSPATESVGYYAFGLKLDLSDIGDNALPQGDGYLTSTIAPDGTLTLAGKTSDGQALLTSGFLGADGQILLYQSLYNHLGSVVGQLNLTLDSNLAFTENAISGNPTWSKPTSASRTYGDGFGALTLDVFGKYLAPSSQGYTILGLPPVTTGAKLLFSQGGLALAAINPNISAFTFTDLNLIILPNAGSPANPAKATLTLNTATGLFSGRFTLVDGSLNRLISYEGCVVRPLTGPTKAVGFFTLPQIPVFPETINTSPILSGRVVIE